MIWYALFAFAAIALVAYRILTKDVRSATQLISKKINVKEHLVDDMVMAMGSQRAQLFTSTVSTEQDTDNQGVYTLVVFQIMKNDNESNISWWKTRLNDSGIQPNMNYAQAEKSFMYLRSAGADWGQIPKFLEVYNAIG